MARGRIVVFGGDPGHADSFAVLEGGSGFDGCDFAGADPERARGFGVWNGGRSGLGSRQPARGKMGRGGIGCNRGPGGGRGAARAAEWAATAAVFGAEWVYTV